MVKLIDVGQEMIHRFQFTQDDVDLFAQASGDYNPIHLDKDYAKTSIFGKRILHGFLGGSVFSKYFGTTYPGPGTIYLKQTMTFYRPMFIENEYEAIFEVLEHDVLRGRVLFSTSIKDVIGNSIIAGEALIQHPDFVVSNS